MFLKRLELHGFKSFAQRTVLEFSPGITAIVGPNGSGKSNIADGIRWVLGEQSMRQLRGKKSDDVIFAGGHGRATMQMAEVALILDNSTSWLPSEFSEVTISRRNFRSGDMEYLVNGQRVRLRDVLLLLAQARIGHDSYTVIGQGQVDQALSVRPEERRGLFEDAAGIRQFQAQRTDAEQKLTLTQTNLSRLHDIISEIEPRLGPLAEQARRARDFVGTRDELLRLLRIWYRQQWRDAQRTLEQSARNEREYAENMRKLQDALAVEDGRIQDLRQQREQLVAQIAQLRRERGEASTHQQTLERDLAVGRERLTSIQRQVGELTTDRADQEDALVVAGAHIEALDAQIATVDAEAQRAAETLGTIERELHSARQEQEREEARLRAAQRDVIQAQARLGAAQADLARLQKQSSERDQALAARRAAAAGAKDRLESTRFQLEEQRKTVEEAQQHVSAIVADRDELASRSAETQVHLDELRTAIADNSREHKALRDRLALLQEWQRSMEGFGAGLRALLQAPAQSRPAVAGVIAQMITVPEGLEQAIEAALGPFLHAAVVPTEDDANASAAWLRERNAGSAYFVWTSGRATSPSRKDRLPEPDQKVHFGYAVDLIRTQPDLQGALADVLTGAYIVRDTTAAERLIAERRPTVPLVTLTGDIWHPHGWLRNAAGTASADKGAQASGSSVLARERELQSLPVRIGQIEEAIAGLRAEQERMQAEQETRRQATETVRKALQQAEAQMQEQTRTATALEREQERAANDAQVSETLMEQLVAEVADLEREIAAARTRVAEHESLQKDTQEKVEDVQYALDELLEQNRNQQESLAQARTTHALKTQETKTLNQRAEQLRGQVRDMETQLKRRTERLEMLTLQQQHLTETIHTQETELEVTRSTTQDLEHKLRDLDTQQADLERLALDLERGQSQERQGLARLEVEYRRSLLEAQRSKDSIETLAQQIRDDLSASGEDDPLQTISAIVETEEVENLPIPSPEDVTRTRRQIEQLRGRLRHLGGYDPEAPQAYEELRNRHEFLTGQVRDMEEAARNLRSVITELDTIMKRRFEETFELVNERFQRHFTTMFSGGHARLELTAPRRSAAEMDDEDEDAAVPPAKNAGIGGVEVFVQIPGKRVQDLSLLSGGERSMVSAALLFALLETNPPPFCLLDEVDAALDEANVVRFCEILKVLAEQTQFVVITHNRVTMTHANVIYGVSMREDSVSRVLSMKLAEVPVTH